MNRLRFSILLVLCTTAGGCNCQGRTQGGPNGVLAADPASIDFGSVPSGSSDSRTLSLTDEGAGDIHLASLGIAGVNASAFSVTVRPAAAIPAGGTAKAVLAYAPSGNPEDVAQLVVESDAANTPVLKIALIGHLQAAPCNGACDSPPPGACADAATQLVYSAGGDCGSDGFCHYPSRQIACPAPVHGSGQCSAGACTIACDPGYHSCDAGSDCCPNAAGALAVSAGESGSCAIDAARAAVKCWGAAYLMGDGASDAQTEPATVSVLGDGVSEVSVGGSSACAIAGSGQLYCWGGNAQGEVGDGTTTSRPLPVPVPGLSHVLHVAVGGAHACAVLLDGTVDCWGQNAFGEVGSGTASLDNVLSPVAVAGLSDAVAVAAGFLHTCALTRNGSVYCWGEGAFGQLGDNARTQSDRPVQVIGLGQPAVSIGAGQYQTCALLRDGSIDCWGYNQRGEVGDGTGVERDEPVPIASTGGPFVSVSCGSQHGCAVSSAGAAFCWGYNQSGQLGDGSTEDRLSPVPVAGLSSGVQSAAAGYFHTCVLKQGGGVACWGLGGDGERGDGTKAAVRTTPVEVIGF